MITTLSDAIAVVDFLVSQGKSTVAVIEEVGKTLPLNLRDQLNKYYEPPLKITPPDLIVKKDIEIPRCCIKENLSDQRYYGAFKRFLIDERKWPKSTVDTLSETSLKLINKLPDPAVKVSFNERGLVVGYIQSGKTANMAALISRAADAGYKLFIILGGFWKDLRAQTQKRMDQEVLGYSDNDEGGPFVFYDKDLPRWVRLTKSGLDGDFQTGAPNDINPDTLKLAVIKKNTKIDTLIDWLSKSPIDLSSLPSIIIDDEADQGSIDTNYSKIDDDGNPIDPTTTNRRIRKLLKLLPKNVYIGFTATPFANVLIESGLKDGLYPKDFIATLPEPLGYFGPKKLFGIGMPPSDLSTDAPEESALNVIRVIEDEDLDELTAAISGGDICPSVLSDSILAFILSSCCRLARGHNQKKDHFSMLVHPSQRIPPHQVFANTIKSELQLYKNAAIRPNSFQTVIKRAKDMWENDFLEVTKGQNDPQLAIYDFDTVWKFAKSLIDEIEVKVLNSGSGDELDYSGSAKRYIVVGGNRLSRGLTLEGLSVSLFTRNSNQYDTLLQMGRWFGYRPQYYDLTRIYVEQKLKERFADLARVEEELRNDLAKYAQEPNPPTPLQLKPIIRSHPTMTVTSRLKMGAGAKVNISFQNTVQQTVTFPVEYPGLLKKNLESAQVFLSKLQSVSYSDSDEGIHIWKDIPSTSIIEFLQSYEFSREARDVNRQNLVGYISLQNKSADELISWDVVLPHGNPKLQPFSWTKEIHTRKVIREPMTEHSIRILSSPNDIKIWQKFTGHDLGDPKRGCIMFYLIDKASGFGGDVEFFKKPDDAEDILGLVLLFPSSNSHETVEYISQR